jgi:glyoxylate reductase
LRKFSVVVTEKMLPSISDKLQERCHVREWDRTDPIPRELLLKWLADAEGLFCSGDVQVDDELLSCAPKLRVIVKSAVGYDNIDIEACTRRGIPVGYTPGVLVEATADLTFGLLLTVARRLHEGWDRVRAGKWENNTEIPFGIDLYGKKLGIVGMGQIGAAVAKRAQASGMIVLYTNRRRRRDEEKIQATYVKLDKLLEESDFVVVLTPLTKETRGMFGAEQFSKMKRTAYFINAARGAIVDTDSLVQALKDGQIAYAALDVTDPEPLPPDHPLLTLPNVFITPHMGSATIETRNRMALLAVDNLLAGLEGKRLPTCVNESVNYSSETD